MRYCFILLFLVFSVTSYAQYDCNLMTNLADVSFSPYELVLIRARYPTDKFGVYRLKNKSEESITIDGHFYDRESTSNKDYYFSPDEIFFWRLKINAPHKGWHWNVFPDSMGTAQLPSDELTIKPGEYVDLIGNIPHDKEEYIKEYKEGYIEEYKEGYINYIEYPEFHTEYTDVHYQSDYQDYAYRISYEGLSASFILSEPYCLRP